MLKFKKLLICVLVPIFLLSGCENSNKSSYDLHIFSKIEECQNIQNSKFHNIDIKIYDSPEEDENLKELKYREFFACKYTLDDLTFELFAYVFEENNIAINYFKNVTGKENNLNPTFSDNSGMFSYRRIVISDNKAYLVSCRKKDKENVLKLINSSFTEQVHIGTN